MGANSVGANSSWGETGINRTHASEWESRTFCEKLSQLGVGVNLMKTSVDSFVTIKEKLFAFLFQFHVVGKRTLLICWRCDMCSTCRAPVCVVVL